jgi:ribulose-phosphate 3-epimerase
MTVNPGFGGQAFIPEMLSKVAEVRRMLDAIQSGAWLEVDGGVSVRTAPDLKKAGATAFVAGSAVFKYPQGTAAGVKALRTALA